MGTSQRDPLGILQPKSDPLGILKKKDGTSDGGATSPGGTESPSPSGFHSPSPSGFGEASVGDPMQRLVDASNQQDLPDLTTPQGAFGKQEVGPTEFMNQQDKENRIRKKDPVMIKEIVKKEKDRVQAERQQILQDALYKPYESHPDQESQALSQRLLDLDRREKDVVNDAAKIITEKYLQDFQSDPDHSQDKRLQYGEKIRSDLNIIGADKTSYDRQKAAMETAQKYDWVQGRKVGIFPYKVYTDEDKVTEQFKYNNEAALLSALYNSQAEDLHHIASTPAVSEFLKLGGMLADQQAAGYTEGARATALKMQALASNPAVLAASQYQKDISVTMEHLKDLPNHYPQVKIDQERDQFIQMVAERYADKGHQGNIFSKSWGMVRDFFAGTNPTEQDIKDFAELHGLDPETVRKEYNAHIPSGIRSIVESGAGVIGSIHESANRWKTALGRQDLGVTETLNKDIEGSTWQMPDALQAKNLHTLTLRNIMYTMSQGVGQMAAYVGIAELGGEALGAIEKGTASAARVLAQGEKVVAPEVMGSLEQNLVAARANPFVTEAGPLRKPFPKDATIPEKLAHANDLAATYAAGYAQSYEQAYQTARQFTSDESKAYQYANGDAFWNGISELILPDISIAKRALLKKNLQSAYMRVLTGSAPMNRTQAFKLGALEMAKIMGLESAEEIFPLAYDTLAQNNLFDQHTTFPQFLRQAYETVVQTSISTIPMGVTSMRGIPNSHIAKSSLFEAGMTPDIFKGLNEEAYKKGKFTTEEYNRANRVVNTMAEVIPQVEKDNAGKNLSQEQKVELAYQMFRHRLITEGIKKADVTITPGLEADAVKTQSTVDQIMNEGAAGDYTSQTIPVNNESQVQGDETQSQNAENNKSESHQAENAQDELLADHELAAMDAVGSFAGIEKPKTLQEAVSQQYDVSRETMKDEDRFIVHVPEALGGLAELAGAKVEPVGKGKVKVDITGLQLKNLDKPSPENASLNTEALPGNGQDLNSTGTAQTQVQQGLPSVQTESPGTAQPEINFGEKPALESIPSMSTNLQTARLQNSIPSMEEQLATARAQNTQVSLNDNGTYTVVPEAKPEPVVKPEEKAQPVEDPYISRIGSVYQFGQVQNVPVDQLSKTYRQGRVSTRNVYHLQENKSSEPVLAYRDKSGQLVVLDGRARVAAAKANNEGTVPVRIMHGTEEQAREVAELSKNISSERYMTQRAQRAHDFPPESLEGTVLQRILGATFWRADGKKSGFALSSFSKQQKINSTRWNPFSRKSDFKNLEANGILSENGQPVEDFVNEWVQAQPNSDQIAWQEQLDMANEVREIIQSYSSSGSKASDLRTSIINRIESINGIKDVPLADRLLPIIMTEKEASFIGENQLLPVLSQMYANIDDVQLSQQEASYFEKVIRDNHDDSGNNADVDAIYNELFNSDNPVAQSITDKLTRYEDQQYRQSARDLSNETLSSESAEQANQDDQTGWSPDDEPPFSKSGVSIARLTIDQAKRISNALAKAFKGLEVIIDKKRFEFAARSGGEKKFSIEVENIQKEVDRASAEYKAARTAFDMKRKELDREVSKDQQDLFGERKSSQENQATNAMFDQRVEMGARDAAMAPFKTRLEKSRKEVMKWNEKLAEAIRSGTSQTSLFSIDGLTYLGVVKDGKVFLNPETMRTDTPVHEIAGHILASWAKSHQPELHNKMIEGAKSAPQEIISHVEKFYPELKRLRLEAEKIREANEKLLPGEVHTVIEDNQLRGEEKFWEEVYATAVGLDGNNIARAEMFKENPSAFQRMREFIKNVYDNFVNWLIDNQLFRPQQSFDPEIFRDMTFSDFLNMVGERMFSGRRLSAPGTRIASLGADYSLLGADDFTRDNFGNITGVKPDIMKQIAQEKNSIRENAIAAGNYLVAPNGQQTSLTEDQWLTTRTKKFQEWDDGKVLRDVNGEAQVYYHSTMQDFNEFDTNTGNYLVGHGLVFFTDSTQYANQVAGPYLNGANVKPVFLRSEKPFDIRKDEHAKILSEFNAGSTLKVASGDQINWAYLPVLNEYIQKLGFDSIVNIWEGVDKPASIAVNNVNNIKSSMSNTTFSDETGDVRFQRIGEASNLTAFQQESLSKAKDMERSGVNFESIFLATGWFQDPLDKKNWKYELPNDNVKFIPAQKDTIAAYALGDVGTGLYAGNANDEVYKKLTTDLDLQNKVTNAITYGLPLSEVLDYPELYEAHPDIGEIAVQGISKEEIGDSLGAYSHDNKTIYINVDQPLFEKYTTLRHEVQHALQYMLGFEPGSNLSFAKDYFKKLVEWTKNSMDDLTKIFNQVKEGNPAYAAQIAERIADYQVDLLDYSEHTMEYLDFFYRAYAGESESRGVERRSRLTDEQRVKIPPIFDMHPDITLSRTSEEIKRPRASPIQQEVRKNERKTYDVVEQNIRQMQMRFNEDGAVYLPATRQDSITKHIEDVGKQFRSMEFDC